MELSRFLTLEASQVASLVRARGDLNAVFWLNGTRRWLFSKLYEKQLLFTSEDFGSQYARLVADGTLSAFKMLVDHGIHTIICPAVYYSNILRGSEYVDQFLLPLIERLINSPLSRELVEQYKVRFFPYGEMEDMLNPAQRERYLTAARTLSEQTRHYKSHRLFVGFCVSDPALAALRSVRSLAAAGRPLHELSRDDLVKEYYGDTVGRVHLTIAHGRMSTHSTPFFTPGDLYFQTSPSLYMDEVCLRTILHDFLFSRPINDDSYTGVPDVQWADIATYYEQNKHQVIGLGRRSLDGKIWSISGADVSDPAVRERIFGV